MSLRLVASVVNVTRRSDEVGLMVYLADISVDRPAFDHDS
jgi:hypothetical protein